MARRRRPPLGRRGFLKGAAVGAAGLVAPATTRGAGAIDARWTQDAGAQTPPAAEIYHTDRPGSDLVVDALKSLDFE